MRMTRHSIAILMFMIGIGGISAPAVAITLDQPVSTSNSQQSTSQLRGKVISWQGTTLVTSVGTYNISNIYVDDTTNARGQVFGESEGPDVVLEFIRKQLVRVKIYR
jgi:hypothetical protein